jgi:CBS domain containing-hemolysin-like protein
MLLSATFSGAETAFYRLSRLRLKLDAISGNKTARRLLWFVNRPAIFVSTLLVGNNIANYSISTATVLIVAIILPNSHGLWVEISATIIVAPFLFVYCEMFPKYLGLYSPNKFLHVLSNLMFFFTFLFLPLTLILWGLNQLALKMLGGKQDAIRLTLGRAELSQILDEGHDTGILFETQRRLANNVFYGSKITVANYILPKPNYPLITSNLKPSDVIEIARKHNLTELPVYAHETFNMDELEKLIGKPLNDDFVELPIGFVRLIDLELADRNLLDDQTKQLAQLLQTELPVKSMVEISSRHSVLTVVILMQTLNCSFGCIINDNRANQGFVRMNTLREILLKTDKTYTHNTIN